MKTINNNLLIKGIGDKLYMLKKPLKKNQKKGGSKIMKNYEKVQKL